MNKLLHLFFLVLFSSSVLADNLTGSTSETTVTGGLGNPYLPTVSCDYNTEKLYFNGTTNAWECVPDRTKILIAAAPVYTYTLSYGGWSICSAAGSQSRTATCTRNDSAIVANSFCSAATTTQSCTPPPVNEVGGSYNCLINTKLYMFIYNMSCVSLSGMSDFNLRASVGSYGKSWGIWYSTNPANTTMTRRWITNGCCGGPLVHGWVGKLTATKLANGDVNLRGRNDHFPGYSAMLGPRSKIKTIRVFKMNNARFRAVSGHAYYVLKE